MQGFSIYIGLLAKLTN